MVAPSSENLAAALLGPGERLRELCFEARSRKWYSGEDLRAGVERHAQALASPRKALVLCFCDSTFESLTAYLGSLLAGHAVILADRDLDPALAANLVGPYRPDFIFGARTDPGPDYAALNGGSLWRATRPFEHCIHPHLAVLLSTSGSTGSPKLVRLSAANVLANATQIRAALAIGPADRAMAVLPMYYSYGLSVINSHLVAGASFALCGESLTSAEFWNVVRDQRCTSLAGVPYSFQVLRRLDLAKLDVPSLATLTQAGGRLEPNLISMFHEVMQSRRGRFFVMYGQTEATARMAVLPPDQVRANLGGVGYAVPGGEFRIEEGEIVYTGPNVMMGYASGPEDLARGDELRGRLRTSDLGYLNKAGCLFVTGRANRFCKVYGLRLNLDEVESMFRAHGPAAVVENGEGLVVYCEHGSDADFQSYSRQVARKLGLNPAVFRFQRVDSMPLTSRGKPDYRRLRAL
jgi:acyl-CoA synthetase (AMP-forming)/AMP-acid ligase II